MPATSKGTATAGLGGSEASRPDQRSLAALAAKCSAMTSLWRLATSCSLEFPTPEKLSRRLGGTCASIASRATSSGLLPRAAAKASKRRATSSGRCTVRVTYPVSHARPLARRRLLLLDPCRGSPRRAGAEQRRSGHPMAALAWRLNPTAEQPKTGGAGASAVRRLGQHARTRCAARYSNSGFQLTSARYRRQPRPGQEDYVEASQLRSTSGGGRLATQARRFVIRSLIDLEALAL